MIPSNSDLFVLRNDRPDPAVHFPKRITPRSLSRCDVNLWGGIENHQGSKRHHDYNEIPDLVLCKSDESLNVTCGRLGIWIGPGISMSPCWEAFLWYSPCDVRDTLFVSREIMVACMAFPCASIAAMLFGIEDQTCARLDLRSSRVS